MLLAHRQRLLLPVMTGIWNILLMSVVLGVTSFGIGTLPLFFSFSRNKIVYLSTVGTGLLLGAALGIIIPEYVPFRF